MLCKWARRRAIPCDPLRRFAVLAEAQIVGVFLLPVQTAFFTIDPQAEIVFVADGYLAGPQHSSDATLITQQNLYVVIEPATWNEDRNIRGHLLAMQSADKTRD